MNKKLVTYVILIFISITFFFVYMYFYDNYYMKKDRITQSYLHKKSPHTLLEKWAMQDQLEQNKSYQQEINNIRYKKIIYQASLIGSLTGFTFFILLFLIDTIKYFRKFLKSDTTYRSQRFGFLVFIFSIVLLILSIIFFLVDDFPHKNIIDYSELYGVFFYISILGFLIAIGFMKSIFQKIYRWVLDGK